MAFTALATTNTTIGPAQWADMAQATAPRFLVDAPNHLTPSYSGGNVSVVSGAAIVAGTRIRGTGTNTVSIPSVSSGTKTYAVVLRVDWSKGATDAATLVAIPSTTVNTSSAAHADQINRIPGVMYDALLCLVTRAAGTSVARSFVDMRMWGGDGGPIRVSNAAMNSPALLDLRAGSMISTDQGVYTKRLDNDMVWRAVGTDSNPWRVWTPTMRYYGKSTPNGTSGGTVAGHGSGSAVSGRYRVVDGMLDGYVSIRAGSTGATWGDGPVTIDLPMACSGWGDTWAMGHLFTTGYGGDGSFDWHMEALIQGGWTRAMLWTNRRIEDARLWPFKVQTPNEGPGTGTPFISGGYPVGTITLHINYPVGA